MDTPLPNPSSLGDIYNMNPGAFGQAQGIIDQGQQAANLSQMMNQQTYDQNAAMDPLKVQYQRGLNDTQAATLPGIVAGSAMKTRQNDNEAATNDAQLKDTLGKLSQADRERHIQDVDMAGQILRQQGAAALNNPIGASDRAKAALAAAGHADMWNPEWENLPPDQLANAMASSGASIGASSQKMLELSAGINAKKDMALDIEREKQKGREAIQKARDETATQIAAGVRSAKLALDKPNMQQLAARMSQLAEAARADGDQVGYAKYSGLANDYMDQARSIPQASPGVSNEKTLDLNKIQSGDISTIPPKPAPRLGGQPVVVPPLGVASAPNIAPPVTPPLPASADKLNSTDPIEAVQAAFGEPADPGKYDYKNVNGVWMRKLKTGPLAKAN